MRKLIWIAAAALLLTGCAAEEEPVFETIGEIRYESAAVVEPYMVEFDLPEEAASQVMAGQDGATLYNWENFEVCVQTVESGNLDATLEMVTGVGADSLTVMKKNWSDMILYQTVWSATGEDGVLLGRALIADDGYYHYCISIIGPETENSQPVYDQIVSSLRIGESDSEK